MQDFLTVQTKWRMLVDCRVGTSGAGVKGSLQQGNGPIVPVPAGQVGLIELDGSDNPIAGSFLVVSEAAFTAGYIPAP